MKHLLPRVEMFSVMTVLAGVLLFNTFTPASGNMRPALKQSNPLETPTWGPKGRRVIMAEERSGKTAIVEWSMKTDRKRTLVSLEGVNSQPAFGPDGSTLYFFHRSGDGSGEIWSLRNDSGPHRYISKSNFGGWVESPAARPSTGELAFFGRRDGKFGIWLRDGHNSFQPIGTQNTFQFSPTWGPHGQNLYYMKKSSSMNIVRYSLPGGHRKVILRKDFLLTPDVHPLSRELVYTTNKAGNMKVMARAPDGSKRVITGAIRKNASPAISPAGTKLAFISNQFRPGELWIMDYPMKDGDVPHTIRVRSPNPLQTVSRGFKITGVATGTISVDGRTRLRNVRNTSVYLKHDSDSTLVKSTNHGVRGAIGLVKSGSFSGPGRYEIVIHVRGSRGRTTRTVPIYLKEDDT